MAFKCPTSGTGMTVLSLIGLMSQIHLPPAVQLASTLTEDVFFHPTAYLMDGQGIVWRTCFNIMTIVRSQL